MKYKRQRLMAEETFLQTVLPQCGVVFNRDPERKLNEEAVST
jgi:hypothetical protein